MGPANYSGILADAVDEGLGVLGAGSKLTVYDGLEEVFNMHKIDIPTRFGEFSTILRNTLGPSAEPILEFIMDRFCRKLGVEPKQNVNLDDCILHVCKIMTTSSGAPKT